MKDPVVYSPFWDNVDSEMRKSQAMVYANLGIELRQINTTDQGHGAWMADVAESASDEEVLFFCDIDAFPLNRDFQHSSQGRDHWTPRFRSIFRNCP